MQTQGNPFNLTQNQIRSIGKGLYIHEFFQQMLARQGQPYSLVIGSHIANLNRTQHNEMLLENGKIGKVNLDQQAIYLELYGLKHRIETYAFANIYELSQTGNSYYIILTDGSYVRYSF
ncbi:hypothetical protein P9X10_02380 [Bacillus cereus]|nr:hypothetical protein [Bacillus cereus]